MVTLTDKKETTDFIRDHGSVIASEAVADKPEAKKVMDAMTEMQTFGEDQKTWHTLVASVELYKEQEARRLILARK